MSSLLRVSIRVFEGDAEGARACFLELAPAGFEEVAAEDGLELVAYTDQAGEARIRSHFEHVCVSQVEQGWEDRWRSFHRPVRAGGLWIGPPWEALPADVPAVVVDPGRAFGTGAHPTTRACVELVAGLERGSLLDAGCGSAVVAVAAARLGFAPVFAVDVDPAAVEVAAATVHRNGVRVDVWEADVVRDELPRTDVIVANIELPVIETLLDRRPAARAVTSGYLTPDAPRVTGWVARARLELEGWAADLFESE